MIIIFDLDGTLINTISDLGQACNYALSACGFPTHKIEDYPRLVGNGINKLIERAGFSVEPPIEMRRVLKSVAKDKKSEGDAIYVVLPESIGSCRVEKMSLDEFKGLF